VNVPSLGAGFYSDSGRAVRRGPIGRLAPPESSPFCPSEAFGIPPTSRGATAETGCSAVGATSTAQFDSSAL